MPPMKRLFIFTFLLLACATLRADGPCGDGCGGCGWDPDVAPAHFMITGTANQPDYFFILVSGKDKKHDTIYVKDSVIYSAHGNSGLVLYALNKKDKSSHYVTSLDKRDDVFELRIKTSETRPEGRSFMDYDKIYISRKELKKAAKAGFIDEDHLPPPLVFFLFSAGGLFLFVRLWRQRQRSAA